MYLFKYHHLLFAWITAGSVFLWWSLPPMTLPLQLGTGLYDTLSVPRKFRLGYCIHNICVLSIDT